MVPIVQIGMFSNKWLVRRKLEYLLFDLGVWTQVSEINEWKEAINDTNCLNMNAF